MSKVSAGTPLRLGNVLIVPLVWQRVSSLATHGGCCLYGEQCAAAVAVRTADGRVRVLAADGREYDVEGVMAAFPQLAQLFEHHPHVA